MADRGVLRRIECLHADRGRWQILAGPAEIGCEAGTVPQHFRAILMPAN